MDRGNKEHNYFYKWLFNLKRRDTSLPIVLLTWAENSEKENGFSIERSTNGVDFSEIDTVSININYYYDWSVTASSTYYYKVRAYNEVGNSDYSNTDNVFVY